MNKPPSRRKKVIPAVSGEPKPASDSAKKDPSSHENPASATITVTAVEIRELTEEEQSERLHLERRVERAFLSAGQALMELRDRRLYRSTHQTFEEYCRDRFNYSRDAAYLKISATVVYENLQKFLPTNGRQIPMPTNERQLRFLAKAELEPAVQADVWQQAVEQAGNKIPSGRIVKDVVDRIRESTKVPNPYHVGEICVLLPKDNPDLRGKAGYWGVVSHVGEYSCTLHAWDGDYTVKIEHLKLLELLDDDCQFMQQLCVRLRQLHQVTNCDSSVDWLLQGLGKQSKPYLSSLQAKLLAAVERNHPKRKPGGQPGHQGRTRKGFGRVDRCEILRPTDCVYCGQKAFATVAVKIEKQSVAQLVERPIEIVEYQRYTCVCKCCGNVQTASWSPDIVPGQDLGVRLQAFLGWTNNYAHMPYEKQQEMLCELGQVEIGLGTIVATNERITQAIEPSIIELSSWVKQTQPNVHVDETPWSVKGIKEWLWVVANSDFCLFTAADTRSRSELETILGAKYTGVLSSDDFSVYNGYAVSDQQKCLAHLRRHFKKLIILPGLHNQAIGEAFVDLIDEAFKNYAHWFETLDSTSYNDWVNQFKSKLQQTLNHWIDKAGAKAGQLLRSLRDKASQWWYFLENPEVPPDNNQAERSLRLAVTKRKISGGSRSMKRFQHTANLLTVVQTCRRQGRSVIDFFAQALIADSNNSLSRPSLLPQY